MGDKKTWCQLSAYVEVAIRMPMNLHIQRLHNLIGPRFGISTILDRFGVQLYCLVVQCAHLEKYDFVNGKDDIPYMKWKIKNVWNHPPVFTQITSFLLDSPIASFQIRVTSWGSLGPWGLELRRGVITMAKTMAITYLNYTDINSTGLPFGKRWQKKRWKISNIL